MMKINRRTLTHDELPPVVAEPLRHTIAEIAVITCRSIKQVGDNHLQYNAERNGRPGQLRRKETIGVRFMIATIYITVICAANLLVAHFGPWVTPINAFVLVGLDMVLRDILHERYGLLRAVLLSAVAGAISYAINPAAGIIAIASMVAFVSASLANAWVYQLLISKPWLKKSNAGNIAAAAVDSGLFPVIAFGAFMPGIILGQFVAKVGGGFVWSWLLKGIRT